MLLKCDPPPLHTERQLAPGRDFEVLHSGHTDWVTCLQHIPGGLVGRGRVRLGGEWLVVWAVAIPCRCA